MEVCSRLANAVRIHLLLIGIENGGEKTTRRPKKILLLGEYQQPGCDRRTLCVSTEG
jgi:hypothetical protein